MEGDTQNLMSSGVRIALIRRRAPEELRRHLQVTAVQYKEDSEQFRDVIERYWRGSVLSAKETG